MEQAVREALESVDEAQRMNESLKRLICGLEQLCVDGLTTDGGHHKQWYLEQILLATIGAERVSALSGQWEKGIAP